MRRTSTWWEYEAFCWNCAFHAHGKNALGLAAQHHDRTGHYITIDASGSIAYGESPEDGPSAESAAAGGI